MADRSDTAARVTNIIAEHLGVEKQRVQPDTLLVPESYNWRGRYPPTPAEGRADLGADSLDIVELAMALEDEFHIEITDDAAEPLNRATVGQLIDTVHQLREQA